MHRVSYNVQQNCFEIHWQVDASDDRKYSIPFHGTDLLSFLEPAASARRHTRDRLISDFVPFSFMTCQEGVIPSIIDLLKTGDIQCVKVGYL